MALEFFLNFSQLLIGILIEKSACYVYCISENIFMNISSIFYLFVKDSHKKNCEIYKYFVWAWKVPWFLLIIFPVVTNHFCLRFFFWNNFLNIDEVQAVFLFSFVVQIVLKLQIFCADPRFLFSFGRCPLAQNPNLYILYPFLALNPTYYLIASFGNWLHILDFLQYVVWN